MADKHLWAILVLLTLFGELEAKTLDITSDLRVKNEKSSGNQETNFQKVDYLLNLSEKFLGTKAPPMLLCNPAKLEWPQNQRVHHLKVTFEVTQIGKLSKRGENIIVCMDHFKDEEMTWLLRQWKPPRHLTNLVAVTSSELKNKSSLFSAVISPFSRISFFDSELGLESYFINGHHIKTDLAKITMDEEQMQVEFLEPRGFLERRSDLFGLKLNVVVLSTPIYVMGFGATLDLAGPLFTTKSGDLMVTLDETKLKGYFIDVLNMLSTKINCSLHVFTREDQIWGHRLENGSWQGLVGTLEKNEADLLFASLTVTKERGEVINYLPVWGTHTFAIFIKHYGQEESNLLVFLKPFTNDALIGILTMVLLLGLSLTVVEHYLLQSLFKNKFKLISHLSVELAKNIWRAFNSLLGGRALSTMKVTEGKIGHGYRALLLVSAFFGVAVLASFRSSITSELSVVKPKLPFNSLEGFLQSNFKLSANKGYSLALQHNLHHGTHSTLIDRVWKKHGKDMLANPIEHEELDTKFLPYNSMAYFSSKEFIEVQETLACKLQLVWKVNPPLLMAPAVSKSSELFELLAFNTELLVNNGFAQSAKRRWQGRNRACGEKRATAISMEKLAMPISLMLLVFVIVPILVLCERCFWKSKSRNDHQLKAAEEGNEASHRCSAKSMEETPQMLKLTNYG